MKIIGLLITVILISACTGCASIAAYTFTDNGCVKSCKESDKTKYYLGSQLSYQEITSPHSDPSYTKEIALKSLFILDFPLTVAADTVLAPFIVVRNAVE